MNILIVNSPLYRESGNYYDEVLPPIGLGYICTHLKEKGFKVDLFDALAGKVPLDKIIDYIEYGDFSHVGLNIFSTNHKLVEEIVTKISRKVTFLIGGAFTKSNYLDIIKWSTNNDISIIIGEADTIVSDIISGQMQEKPIFQNKNRKVYQVDKNSKYFPQDISSLNIDRTFFHYEPTINTKTGNLEGNIVVSRGCVYDCTFCSAAISLNKLSKVRTRTPEKVVNEILQIIKLHPDVKSIRILDDLFLRNSKSILDAIKIFLGLNLEWRAMAHIQSFKKIEDELLVKMKQSGCCELSIGIESGNDEILYSINKLNTANQIKETIERIFKCGISVKGYFIIGFPGETYEQMQDTYKIAKYLKKISLNYGVDFRVSVFQFRPYHGTQLYDDIIKKGNFIGNIEPSFQFEERKIGEYDFSSGNFSNTNIIAIVDTITQLRKLNDEEGFYSLQ